MKRILSFIMVAAILVTSFSIMPTMTLTAEARQRPTDVISIPDNILRTYLTEKNIAGKNYYSIPPGVIDRNGDRKIQRSEAEAVTVLELAAWGIRANNKMHYVKSLRGLEAFKNLTRLTIRGEADLADLTPLANLTKLKYLHISDAKVSTLAPLKKLKNLTTLIINGCKLKNMNNLSSFKKLENLELMVNEISDISGAATLPIKMKTLKVYDNYINSNTRANQKAIDAAGWRWNTLGGLERQWVGRKRVKGQEPPKQRVYKIPFDPDDPPKGDSTKPTVPKSFKVKREKGTNAKITWRRQAGRTYFLQRSTKKNKGFKTIYKKSGKSFTSKNLKKGTTYYFRIRCMKTSVRGTKLYSKYSKVKKFKA